MNIQGFLLLMIFALNPMMWAQNAPQTPASGPGRAQLQAEHRREMMEMHQQEMKAMKADVEKMKSSLAQMKANLLTIRDRNEMDRWRNNIDMWDAMVDHMDRMLKRMESMGPGTTGPGMGGDLLWLNGDDLRALPLLDRKRALKKIVPTRRSRLLYVDHVAGRGEDLFRLVCKRDLEGVVAKWKRGAYMQGERTSWVKIKNPNYSQSVGRERLFEKQAG